MAQFSDIKVFDNGARFQNVDLHIHSYGASHDVKDTKMTPEAIVDSAVKQGLSVIAITDHNTNKNVELAIAYAQEHYAGQILVLPGVEITTAHGHLLAYFPPERIADLAKLISRLELIGEMGKDNTRTAKSMSDTITEVEKLEGISIAAHIDREKTGFNMFTPGFQNWKKDIITNCGLYGLECDTLDALLWYSDYDETGSAGVERKKMLAARQVMPDLSARHQLAHIQGSDAHTMEVFEHKDPNKLWTRIKLAEFSFNALRVALIDPMARVRACASVPHAIPRIHGVAITGGFLHGTIIHFSDNLNCFIGGRGTGKSTAIRAVAYAFGLNNEFGDYDNCPDAVTVFCEDINGILYRYVRTRNGDIEVKAKEDRSVTDVPIDAFRIEYFGQGELAKVAEDPLKRPELLQAFLDRHTNLRDLIETEESLVNSLLENAGRLNPLETAFWQLATKKKSLDEIEKKLKIAEEGNLREVVAMQSKLASEKTIRESIEAIAVEYTTGWNLSHIQRDFDQIVETSGTCTGDEMSNMNIDAIKSVILASNSAVKNKEKELNIILKTCANELRKFAGELKVSHQRMSGEVAKKLADLKARGLATDIPGLELLLRQKTSVAKDIASVEQRANELKQCREQRNKLRAELAGVREQMTNRRKSQLKGINANLAITITDYTIFVKYDDAGITAEFESFLQEKMHGTHLQDNLIETICSRITPSEFADLVLECNHEKISTVVGISSEWAKKIEEKLCYWNVIFDLQALAKQPKPIITVRTKSVPTKDIPVLQLSDGQRHTILLTIAMLAESNVPLLIDQPEDDLDNAFIFSSIVATLRAIKERRQVILVTHNANIAVLGDSELIIPMCRENDCGKTKDRGAIDKDATKRCVLDILEGGTDAFLRRKEMYNH
ncbi:MAG: PHP domain-containing protein [Victivallales bacterium]